jgi:preprotein translocase subunit SecY
MQYVPTVEPFANGETIKEAVYSSLVPRFLDKNKTTAGGRENFLHYTGLYIMTDTTMCLGLLGEAYVNYGVNGGILLMLILGIVFNRIFAFFIGLGKNNSYFLLCLPLIFLQAVKPDTEFVVVVNHLTKATLIVFMVYLVLPNLFGSLKNKYKTKSVARTIHSKNKRRPLRVGTQTS